MVIIGGACCDKRSKLCYVRDQDGSNLADLAEAFGTLRKFHMKLRPAKCAFGVRSGKFLGYMVIEKMIEVNLEQIRAIQEMKHPANLNEIQRLAERIVALSRFISRSAERSVVLKPYGKPRTSTQMRNVSRRFRI
ncbi:UNVERIFIED_CONTAM: hypothetical protein Scaly_1970100 [Sesamum calycinum]|uniref:Uncharacterized protein n=1 Tax=Sesamum calycinum TaxID=2727403 RepID=A0AAW2N0F8_9LAMI